MPAFADITINDGQGTPVSHTFNPTENKAGVAIHHDRSGGIAIGYYKLGVSLRMPVASSNGQVSDPNTRVVRSKISIDLPVLETLASGASGYTPPPTVAYVCRTVAEFIFPERSTLANRKDVRALLYNALNHANVKKVIEDLEAIY